jgi:hypothetical protein
MLYICLQLLAGLLLGYLQATLVESLFHRYILHASSRVRKFWLRHPRLCGMLSRAYYSHHTMHHARTFKRDFVTQFRDDAERERLDRSIPPELLERMQQERYGLTMRGWSMVRLVAPGFPLLPLTFWIFGGWVMLGSLVPLLILFPAMSRWAHPHFHMPHAEAMRQANWVGRLWLKSRLMRFTFRHHWLHHKHLTCNYNLLVGGDWLLGVHRAPTPEDLDEMNKLGIPIH